MASRRPAGEPAKLWTLSITWKDLFAAISPELLSIPADNLVHGILAKALFSRTGRKGHGVNLNDEHFQTVKIHLMALGLIECRLNQSKGGALLLYWHLTQAGEHLMLEARAARPAVAA
jgi:hypothetical protein